MALTLRPIKPDIYPAGAFPIPTGDQVFGVGRDVGNELRVEHASVSARHARIEVLGDAGIEVVDCGSSNGTFVNGFRVERSRLEPGDLLRFATAEFSVQESHGAAPPCLAKVPAVVEEHLSRAQADGELEALRLVFEEEREVLRREIAHLREENGRRTTEASGLRNLLETRESELGALDEQGKAREEQLRRLQRDLEEAAAREQRLQTSLNEARREVIEREGIIAGLRYEIGTRDGQLRQLDEQRAGLQQICDAYAASEVEWQTRWAELSVQSEAEWAGRTNAESHSADLLGRLGQLESRLLTDWQAWIPGDNLPELETADAETLFHRIDTTAAAIRGQLDLIEPIWLQYGDGVQAELAGRTGERQSELSEIEAEIARRRDDLAAIEADLAQFRETMDVEVRRAQGLSRKGIEVEIPKRFEAMVIAKDREEEIYRALIERLEVLDLLLDGYRGARKLKEVAQELTAFRNRLVNILESGGVRPFELGLGTFLSPKHRREVQVLSRKGWGTRQYSETPFQPGEVVKVVRPGYRVGDGDAAVILRKVEVLIRGGED
ncbi:MAG: FHA domain-containing protein [Verrucomicrobiales bacterium]|nr:FHA domain-containing protein [Verrucomicrobiales bacterium]